MQVNQEQKQKPKANNNFVHRALNFLKGSPIQEEERIEADDNFSKKIPYIPFYTSKNDFPVLLSLLAEVVPEHDAAIRSKKRWAVPEKFGITSSNPSTIIEKTCDESAPIEDAVLEDVSDHITEVNVEGDNLKDILRKIVCDLETVGNSYIEMVRFEVEGERFLFVNHHDPTTALIIRRDEMTVGFSADWSKVGGFRDKGAEVFELPLYRGRRTNWKTVNGTERCVIHLKSYRSGRFHYGLPDSVASMLSQKIGFEISRHNLDRLETDFFPRLFFEFFNTDGMSSKEQEGHLSGLMNTFTKKGKKRFGIFAQYNEFQDSATKIHKLELDNKLDYETYKTQIRQDILTAHGVHPVIAGVLTAGSLGSSKELREIFTLFNSTVIAPLQEFIVEKFLTPYMKESGLWLDRWENVFLTMSTQMPVSFVGDLDLNKVLTVNEAREMIGKGELGECNESGEFVPSPSGDRIIDQDQNTSQNV